MSVKVGMTQTIPTVIFSFVSTGIGTGFIPLYSRIKNEQGLEVANTFTNNLINLVLSLCAFIVIGGLLFAKPLVRLFASGFDVATLELAVQFTRISIFAIFCTGLIGIYSGLLRLHDSYVVPNLIGLPMNAMVILSILISSRSHEKVLLIGTLVARATELFFMIPFAQRKGFKFLPVLDPRDENIKNMLHIALPVIIGTSVNQLNVLVDRTLASRVAVGGITALNYADRLNGFVQGIFVMSILSVTYPVFSRLATRNDMQAFRKTLSESISMITVMIVPISFGSLILARPIVDFLFGRGAFTSEATEMTASALRFYSIGMMAFGLRDVLARAFYSLQDTKTPMINGVISVVANVALSVIFAQSLGIGGLALGTSLSGIVASILLLITLRRKIGSFGLRSLVSSLVKITAASVVMSGIVLVVQYFASMSLSTSLSLMLSIGVGTLSYFLLIWLLAVPETRSIIHALKSLFRQNVVEESSITKTV